MSNTARMIDDRSSAQGRLFVMTDAELAMGASALGIFAEAAFVAYCSVSTAEPAVMRGGSRGRTSR
jgi:hypothetical protein